MAKKQWSYHKGTKIYKYFFVLLFMGLKTDASKKLRVLF